MLSYLKQLVDKAYKGILETIQSPFLKLQTLESRSAKDKSTLEAMRSKAYKKIGEALKNPTFDYTEINREITQDTKAWINRVFTQELKALGKPPTQFSVLTLGSLARQETGPITDLEIGFLIEKDSLEARKYFYTLAQNVSDRLYLLGEHPSIGGKGLRMDEADNAPPHFKFFARNANFAQNKQLLTEAIKNRDWDKIPFEGSRPFLATPEQFADFTLEKFPHNNLSKNEIKKRKKELEQLALNQALKKNPSIKNNSKAFKALRDEIQFYANEMFKPYSPHEQNIARDAGRKLGRNTAFLFGDEGLYNKFKTRKESHLIKKNPKTGLSERQTIAYEVMINDISQKYEKKSELFINGKLGKKIDLKRELYRFGEQFITNLGFYYNAPVQNTTEIVKHLIKTKRVTEDFGAELIDYMNFATKMRLKKQMTLKHQSAIGVYIDKEAFEKDRKDLEEKVEGLKLKLNYLQSIKANSQDIAKIERELNKEQINYEHLLEMAPGKIINPEDEKLLREKYAPFLKKMFDEANIWTKNIMEKRDCPIGAGYTAPLAKMPKPVQTNNKPAVTFAKKLQEKRDATIITPAAQQESNPSWVSKLYQHFIGQSAFNPVKAPRP
ncbi:MAG TPA: DUF294 nucleotidyltransferase-like domain-containing protein [Gammaproteobacteria bacterium]|nr:DUF294 nucleotidyltransferase-like domain-containing protein [Gammaproteobacteria bacterium]